MMTLVLVLSISYHPDLAEEKKKNKIKCAEEKHVT